MNVDYNSLEAVVSLIEKSKLKKFIIQRIGAPKNSSPIFECLNSNTNSDAVQTFKDWAALIENRNPYEMLLFDNEENINNENNKKRKQIRFTFSLAGHYVPNQQPAISGSHNAIDVEALTRKIIEEVKAADKKDRLSVLEEKIDALLNGDYDDDDEEEETTTIMNPNLTAVMTIMDRIFPKKDNVATAINGATEGKELSEDQKKEALKALSVLYKNDPHIIKHINKLANISENNKTTFALLLNNLDLMA